MLSVIFLFLLLLLPSLSNAKAIDLNKLFNQTTYVALQKTGAIEVFPQEKTWKGYPDCHYVEVSPHGKMLIASGFKTGRVYFVNTRNGEKIATVKIGKLVQGVDFSPHGHLAVAVDASGGKVDVIGTKKFDVIHTIKVGKNPHNLVFSHDGHYAYVSVQGENKIAIVNMHKDSVIRDIDLKGMQGGPHNLALSTDGKVLWVRNHPKPKQKGTVAVINLKSDRVEHYITVGLFHGGMDVMPNNKLAFTTNIGGHTVDAISTQSDKIVKTINVGAGPHGVRSSNHGHYVYVSTTRGNQLAVINTRSLKVITRIPLKGKFGFWVAVQGRQ